MKFDVKDFAFATFLSLVVITILNLLLSQVMDNIPVLKTGKALILVMVGVALVMLFVFASDKKFEKSEIFMFFAILATLVGIFYITKKYIPEIYSMFPDNLKQVADGLIK